VYGDELSLHTWLTLDSMEILDVTFLPTALGVGERSAFSRRAVAADPDTLPRAQPRLPAYPTHGLKYEPFVIGLDFLQKLVLPTGWAE
jgi:hypothetical protein